MVDWQYEGRYGLACLTIVLYLDKYYILSFPGCYEVAVKISAVASLSCSNTACGSSKTCHHQTPSLGKQLTTVPSCDPSLLALLKTSLWWTNSTSRKEKQLLMFISLAYWKIADMPAAERTPCWRARPTPASQQKIPQGLLFHSLFPHAESFSTDIWLQSSHALGQLSCCQLLYWPRLSITHIT